MTVYFACWFDGGHCTCSGSSYQWIRDELLTFSLLLSNTLEGNIWLICAIYLMNEVLGLDCLFLSLLPVLCFWPFSNISILDHTFYDLDSLSGRYWILLTYYTCLITSCIHDIKYRLISFGVTLWIKLREIVVNNGNWANLRRK